MRIRLGVVFTGGAAVAVALFGLAWPTVVTAAPDLPGDDVDDSQTVIQPLLDAGLDQAWLDQDLQARLDMEAMAADFEDIWAEASVDYSAKTITVQYYANGDPAQVKRFLTVLEEARSRKPILDIIAKPVDFTTKQTDAVMDTLTANSSELTTRLGLPDIVGMGPEFDTGVIVIYTTGDVFRDVTDVVGWPARVEGNVKQKSAVQISRWTDSKPISGGAGLMTSSGPASQHAPDCTLGFVWTKNTGEVMGGGANHCTALTGVTAWYNAQTSVGGYYYYNTAADSMLLRSNPQGGFNANIWVGPADSTEARRWVKGTLVSNVNGAVALSASRSGQHTTTVRSINQRWNEPGLGWISPLTVTNFTGCIGGDSGAPWFSSVGVTVGDGKGVLAHGQHFGNPWGYCSYIPVAATASALGATIRTG